MLSVFLMGGLGNQLFQIFALIAHALQYKHPFTFQYSDKLTIGNRRSTYWNNMLKRLKPFTHQENLKLPVYKERGFHYTPIPYNKTQCMLYGYFQSYKYFEQQYENIIRLIGIRGLQSTIKDKYESYFKEKSTIAMHFRLGDYKQLQAHHPVMKLEYYKNALDTIINKTSKKDWTILYFCEQEDNAIVNDNIKTLHGDYPDVEFIKVDDSIVDWEQMLIMSCCQHNIIANSTFSWWGAYFNDSVDKIVCYPKIWFGPALTQHNTRDLFRKEWIQI
jgi:hypothetical protein